MGGYDPNNVPPLRASNGGSRKTSASGSQPQRGPLAQGSRADLAIRESHVQPSHDVPRLLQEDPRGSQPPEHLNGQRFGGFQPAGSSRSQDHQGHSERASGAGDYTGLQALPPGVGQQVALRASEGGEEFDPYAPSKEHHRRTSSSGGDGYPAFPSTMPEVYLNTDLERQLPRGADGRQLPPVQPGAAPPPAHVPAWQYAAEGLQSSYAPPESRGGSTFPTDARQWQQDDSESRAKSAKAAASAFTAAYDIEARALPVGTTQPEGKIIFKRPYLRKTKPNILGWILMLFFFAALIFYIYVRAAKTLNLGPKFIWYGILILVVEIVGSTTTMVYGLNHLFYTVDADLPLRKSITGKAVRTDMQYHIRALVPCYKESLQILQLTIMALREAELPEGCSRTIYLCDDGKDQLKRDWVDSLSDDVVYVSGRNRKKGEMNGKSGNMNNVLAQIYPTGCFVPSDELIAVFDADQVAKPDFFLKTTPMFDAGDNVGMVLTPQYNSNLSKTNDIFNHSNLHFWWYMQPGYDALGFISCTGTNFMVRANAYKEAGWTPTWTLTEDFALGMEMKRNGWHCRYLNQYLAVGEAPDGVRNCFQQRSRWTKGHFQIILSRHYCPLFRRRLDWLSRLLYCSGVWSYIINAVTTPIFMAVPIVTIWVGVFPMIVNFWLALGSTIYITANCCIIYYCKRPQHLSALWFAGLANQLFWWTYAKAMWRSFTSACCCSNITFKATAKGGSKVGNSAFRDLWIHGFTLIINSLTLVVGLIQVFTGATIVSPLLISILWCVYNMIPPVMVFTYAWIGRKHALSLMSFICMILSVVIVVGSLALLWWIQGTVGYNPQQFAGGAAQNPTYIGFVQQIRKWVEDGVKGITKLTG